MIIFWLFIIIAAIFLLKWIMDSSRRNGEASSKAEDPLDILKRRYAAGEIDKEEFEEKKIGLTE